MRIERLRPKRMAFEAESAIREALLVERGEDGQRWLTFPIDRMTIAAF
jgi:hypothetical protein